MPRLSALCFLFPFRLSALPQNIVNVSLDNVIFPRPVFKACHHQRTGLPAALGAFHTPLPLRHVFCTNLANAGMNPKALQYIMGHSNIDMTLSYDVHAASDCASAEMERLTA